ncbi:translation initiation factor IF-3 [bacterium]|nr:translation initiation factor IF-3 [bacterium]
MKYYRLNYRIKAPKVRLIDENGKHIGVVETSKAIEMAQKKGLDLIEVNPNQDPPVAKILDFGQFKYQLSKKEKKQKSKKGEVKGIRLSLRVGKHDLEFKRKQVDKFLKEGNKVKIEMLLRGRERTHADLGEKIINDFISSLENIKIEQPLKKQGPRITILISRSN